MPERLLKEKFRHIPIRKPLVIVRDHRFWKINDAKTNFMHFLAEVKILHKEKIPLIEAANALKNLFLHHETSSSKKFDIGNRIMVKILHDIAPEPLFKRRKTFENRPFDNEIRESHEPPAGGLDSPIMINNFRPKNADFRMGLQIFQHGFNAFFGNRNIRIHKKEKLPARTLRTKIIRLPIADISRIFNEGNSAIFRFLPQIINTFILRRIINNNNFKKMPRFALPKRLNTEFRKIFLIKIDDDNGKERGCH